MSIPFLQIVPSNIIFHQKNRSFEVRVPVFKVENLLDRQIVAMEQFRFGLPKKI